MDLGRAYTPERIKINQSEAHSQNLIQMLAWAAEAKIPFDRALRTLTHWNMPILMDFIYHLLKPIIWLLMIITQSKRYRRIMIAGVKPFFRPAVKSAILDLEDGYSLSHALEKHLKWWLPAFYLESVKLAEEKDCLAETLKNLAANTAKVRRRRRELAEALFYPALMTFSIFVITWFLTLFILPKYNKIFEYVGDGAVLPYLSQKLLDFSRGFGEGSSIFLFFLIQIPWILYMFFFTNRGDWILVKIPLIRRSILRRQMIEAIQGLSIYSRMKIPLHEELELVSDSMPSSILKNKFIKLREDTLNGVDFKQSWLNNFQTDHLINFHINNGFQVDKLSDSLDRITILLQEEDTRKHGRIIQVAEPMAIMLISLVVCLVVFAMFQPMIELIEISVGWEN